MNLIGGGPAGEAHSSNWEPSEHLLKDREKTKESVEAVGTSFKSKSKSKSKDHITTDGQSASLFVVKPHLGPQDQIFITVRHL
jgi:hypothetical protein